MSPEPGRSEASPGGTRTSTREHIRGSTLLLVGRGISLLVNFAVQVFTVRYLAKNDYGAFAYAFAIAGTVANAILLGLGRAVSRMAPMYEEKRDYGAMYGTLFLAGGTVLGLGLLVVAAANALAGVVVEPYVSDPLAGSLLLVLIALAPLQALDSLGEHVLAAFAGPWAVFFRRFVLGPALKLFAVLFVVLAAGDVWMLAVAYVVAGGVAVLLYGPILRAAFSRRGLVRHFVRREMRFPVREVLTFGLPLFFSDVAHVARTTLVVIVLEAMRSTAEVADFRAIAPVAGLNLVVLQSMKLLYVPAATRLLARGDHAGIDHLFWQTAVWISVATFPVLAVCTALAEPVTVTLFGDRYAGAGAALVVLAAGNYVNAAMGLNAFTLQVYGRVRSVAIATGLGTGLSFLLAWFLVPAHGALGAAVAVSLGHVLENLLFHLGLHVGTEVKLVRGRYLLVYASLAGAILLLLGVDSLLRPPAWIQGGLVVVTFLALLRAHRRTMAVGAVFPELRRLPVVRNLLGVEEGE